jgi:CelD/BcsL family acetyltransferase involved in cellulose biosynthesis
VSDRHWDASLPLGRAAARVWSVFAPFGRRIGISHRADHEGGRVMLIKDLKALGATRDAWEALEPAAHGPIEHFEWSRSCVEGLPGLDRLQMFTVWDGGHCRAIAPLAVRASSGFRLESIGVKELFEPMSFMYASRAALARLCDELARQRRPIDLQRVTADAPVEDELRRAFRGRGWVRVRPADPYPSLAIDSSWSAPETHFNSGRRSDFRRALRRAERLGPTHFEVVTPAPSDLHALLGQAYEIEMQGWKGRNGTALAVDPSRSDFYSRYFAACCDKGILRIAFMRIGGKAIGMQLAVETKQRLWLIKIGHNEAYARSSPGTLLMLEVARYAAQRGLKSIEFLGRDEPWTRLWTERLCNCIQIRIYPYALASLVPFGLDLWRWTATRMLRIWKREQR